MARPSDPYASHLTARSPVRLNVVLNGFGGAAIILAVLFFGGSFYVENDIGRAFCLGAFFSGLLGGIVLFGFAKIIEMLDAIRQQTVAAENEHTSDIGAAESRDSPGPAA